MYNTLIADDEPAVREGLSIMIDWNSYGFNISNTAKNGRDALDKLSSDSYDLIITDIRMPVLNGLQLIKEIREKSPDIKIMIISGYSEFEYAKRAIEYGVKAYLLKPVNREELLMNILSTRAELDQIYLTNERKNMHVLLKNKHPKIIYQIINYLEINYTKEDINLKTIAETFFINPAYLGQLFKNSLNETFSNYINRKRISEAKRLLLDEGFNVNEITEKVGYKDNDYFYKQFRRYEGISFAEYKERSDLIHI